MTLREQLLSIASAQLGRPVPDGELDLDSMEKLALVVAIEDHFQVAFEPEDEEQARTIDDVVAILDRHLAGRA